MGALKEEYYPSYTYEDYKIWEGEWELINGIPYAMAPAPMIRHQKISSRIAWQLEEKLSECEVCQSLLPIDWKINEDTIVEPDNLVICYEPDKEAYITKAPEIIFEILSKSTAKKDKTLKYDLYEQEGVAYYIIVNPDESIAKVYGRNSDGKYMKLCDARKETVTFKTDKCQFTFDFSKIW